MSGRGSHPLAGLCAALLAALLCSCTMPLPTSYLLLELADPAMPAGQQPALSVGPVQIPDYLKRNSLAVRLDDNTLSYRGNERWAEPLDLGIQRLLGAALGQQLDTARVVPFPSLLAADAQYRVALNVFQLEARGDTVVLTAEWLLYQRGEEKPLASASIDRRRTLSDASGGRIASAMSELLAALAADAARAIASDISAGDTSHAESGDTVTQRH